MTMVRLELFCERQSLWSASCLRRALKLRVVVVEARQDPDVAEQVRRLGLTAKRQRVDSGTMALVTGLSAVARVWKFLVPYLLRRYLVGYSKHCWSLTDAAMTQSSTRVARVWTRLLKLQPMTVKRWMHFSDGLSVDKERTRDAWTRRSRMVTPSHLGPPSRLIASNSSMMLETGVCAQSSFLCEFTLS